MRRRTVLSALVGLCTATVGCTGGCNGVALAIELTPPEATEVSDMLDFDELALSAEERDVLARATGDRVVGCTRDDIPALEHVVEVVAEHAGVSEHDLYYSQGKSATPARFRGERYRAVILYDTAETGGGPLGA